MDNNLPAVRSQAVPAAPTTALALNTMQDVLALADVLAKSGYFADARSAAQAAAKILFGRELGFPPMASITGIHVIEGKPSVGALLMSSMIKRSGRYTYQVVICDRTRCKLRFLERVDSQWQPLGEVELTWDEAVASGLALGRDGRPKANWARSPDDMLFARCISKGFRRYCPDLAGGVTVYVEDEIESPDTPALPAPAPALDVEPTFVALPTPIPVEDPSPNAPAPTSEPTPEHQPNLISEQDYQRLCQLYRDHQRTQQDAERILGIFGIRKMSDLPTTAYARAIELLIQGPVTTELVDAISAEIQALGLPWEAFQRRLLETTGVSTIAHLTRVQAEDVLTRLRARRPSQPAA